MGPLSHIFLHLAFCGAMMNAPLGTVIPLHVTMTHHNRVVSVDNTFKVARDGKDAVVEFDVPAGIYRMVVESPKYGCMRLDYVNVLEGLNRSISETLGDTMTPPQDPVALFDGTAPLSFAYTHPTFVLFDQSQACNQPVGKPIAVRNEVEYDQGSYHLWLHSDPALAAQGPLVAALRLQTATSTAHYVRVKIPFPMAWSGWPNVFQMNVTEDMVDGLATEKIDTLLCPKIWTVSVPD